MKKLKLSIVLILSVSMSVIVFQSCESEAPINEENKIPINANSFNLKLKSFDSIGKEFNLPENNIQLFFKKHFNELLKLDEGLEFNIYSKKGKKTFIIKYSNDKKTKQEVTQEYARYETETICKTCTNEACVTTQLSAAIGEGNIDVNIRVRVKKLFGVQTGLEVCYDRIKE